MTTRQLDLFRPAGPEIRRAPSDPELWAAGLHPDGFDRMRTLLDARHGEDAEAKARDLDAFLPPHAYSAPAEVAWAGWMRILAHRYRNPRP